MLRDPELRVARGQAVLALAMTGRTSNEIAEIFGLSKHTVREMLTDARRAEVFTRARDYVGTEMIPRVLAGLEVLLAQGDKDTILWLAEKLALAGSGGTRHLAPWGAPAAPAADTVEETFDAFRLRITRRVEPAAGETGAVVGPVSPNQCLSQGAARSGATAREACVEGEVIRDSGSGDPRA